MKHDLCLSFPTTVLVLHNNSPFVSSLIPLLDIHNSVYQILNCPYRALEIINSKSAFNNPVEQNLKRPSSKILESRTIFLYVNTIYRELFNSKRFNLISTIVIDYDTMGISCFDLCNKIQNPYIRKVILIGEAEEQIAIDAFNNGQIDGFVKTNIKKKTVNNLNRLIKKLQNEYFFYLGLLAQDIIKHYPEEETAFGKFFFRKFLCGIFEKYSIIEFYLIESIGSYLMINSSGDTSILYLRNTDQMDAIYHEIKSVTTVLKNIKENLKNKKYILCYISRQNESLPEYSQWEKYMEKAVPIENTDFFYAISKDTSQLITSDFVSFKNYRAPRSSLESESQAL